MDDFFQITKSDLLKAPDTSEASKNKLADESWGAWIEDHKLLTGAVVVTGVVGLAFGARAISRLVSKDALAASESGASRLLNNDAGNVGGRLAENVAVSPAPALKLRLSVGGLGASESGLSSRASQLPLAKPVEAAHSTALPVSSEARTLGAAGRLAPTHLERPAFMQKPGEAYSWGAATPATGDPLVLQMAARDSRSMLDRLAAGDMSALPKEPSVFERGMAQIRKAPTIKSPTLEVPGTGGAVTHVVEGPNGIETVVVAGAEGQPAAQVAEWVPLQTMRNDVTITAPRGMDAATAELLGYERAQGTRPLLDEIVTDTHRSTASNPFARHLPAISRMEMPALSVRRKKGFGL